MEQIRVSHRLVILCFVCLTFSAVMCSEPSDALIKTYVSSSLSSTYNFVDSDMLKSVQWITELKWDSLVIQSKLPVFVTFTSPARWCIPCQILSPLLDQLDRKYGDQIKFFKLDVDADADVRSKFVEIFRIRSIPTTIVFKDGEERYRVVGAAPSQLLAVAKRYA